MLLNEKDRAAGCLVGMAYGDALGVPYEYGSRPLPPLGGAGLFGGGLGDYEPGEWSDDTQMAICIALAATEADLTSDDGLDAVAARFEEWYRAGPADIGVQTGAVLRDAARRSGRPATRLSDAATALHASTGRSAGNGALMRTAPVAIALAGDSEAISTAARAIAELTHKDPLAGDSCVLWSLTIDSALRLGGNPWSAGPEAHLEAIPAERRNAWASWLADARDGPPESFPNNGFTVTALQAAWAACLPPNPAHEPDSFARTVHRAVNAGGDTDTVAAIAGALSGALYGIEGIEGIPENRTLLHGWPGLTEPDLSSLARRLAEQADHRRRPPEGNA
jgi:ADP-ribosyl-[dinitrogen reductase] hydrolase